MKKKSLIVICCCAILLLLLSGFLVYNKVTPESEWVVNLQKQKNAPYQNGSFVAPNHNSTALRFRVFKPAIDIAGIPAVSTDWRKDPVDSFLRQCYIDLLDPNPTFAKYAESYVDGMKSIEETLTKFPELRDNPRAFFKKFRGDYVERKLVGEIVIDDVHLLVYVYVNKEGGVLKVGSPFLKNTEGNFLAYPDAWTKIPILDTLAQDQYNIVCKHFPEYDRKQ